MKITLKIVAILATLIGLMAIVTGTRVLLGFFDPDYVYFETLIVYNIVMGLFSVIVGILIWLKNDKSLLLSFIITGFHIVMLLSLLTIYREIISNHSIGAMIFRSSVWVIFSSLIWKGMSKLKL